MTTVVLIKKRLLNIKKNIQCWSQRGSDLRRNLYILIIELFSWQLTLCAQQCAREMNLDSLVGSEKGVFSHCIQWF